MKKSLKTLVVVVLFFSLLLTVSCTASYQKSQKLIEAIEKQDFQKVSALLESGTDPNKLSGPTNRIFNSFAEYSPQSPLSVACSTGNLEIVRLLISHGATAAYQEGTGWSPLVSTLFYYQPNDLEIVQLLLENGADMSQKESGYLPVFHATQMIPKVYDAKMNNGTVFCTEYDEETAKGIVEIVKLLMGEFDVNDQTDTKTTLLMNACANGNYALVEYLLSIGADTTLTDDNGKTAYDIAFEKGYIEIAELVN